MNTEIFDVVVVGGGVAGLCSAIAAFDSGAKTILIEASESVGGTASWSGGAIWVPANRHMREAGLRDSVTMAVDYMMACAGDGGEENQEMYEHYAQVSSSIIDYLEAVTPLKLEVGTMPDYQGGVPGGFYTPGRSRSLAPKLFNVNRLGDHKSLLRRSPYGTVPFTFDEFAAVQAAIYPHRLDPVMYAERVQEGVVGWGEALTAALYEGVIERGIDMRVGTRGYRLIIDRGVKGIEVQSAGANTALMANKGVILCCGGFEWDKNMVAEQFNGVDWIPSTVPTNVGDGWRLAEKAGAQMTNIGYCWGWPSYTIPKEVRSDGLPLVRSCIVERCLPHCIVVDRNGKRFVDESLPYHEIQKVLIRRDKDKYLHLPAWHVFDHQFREKYTFGPVSPEVTTPEWMFTADTLEELGKKIGVSVVEFKKSVSKFNVDAETGRDTEFHRGEHPYGQFWGDPDNPMNYCLGTIEKPPFYAVEMVPSTIGTCAGPRINKDGAVLDMAGKTISGLYAAGNVTGAISGRSYFGPGGTIGPAMIVGVLAGRTAARRECT